MPLHLSFVCFLDLILRSGALTASQRMKARVSVVASWFDTALRASSP
jgi:hypothetical protein